MGLLQGLEHLLGMNKPSQKPLYIPNGGPRPYPSRPIDSPTNRGAVPQGLQGALRQPALPVRYPASFTFDRSTQTVYPGTIGGGPLYLNPSQGPFQGVPFQHTWTPARYQVAPLSQPKFPSYNKLQQVIPGNDIRLGA